VRTPRQSERRLSRTGADTQAAEGRGAAVVVVVGTAVVVRWVVAAVDVVPEAVDCAFVVVTAVSVVNTSVIVVVSGVTEAMLVAPAAVPAVLVSFPVVWTENDEAVKVLAGPLPGAAVAELVPAASREDVEESAVSVDDAAGLAGPVEIAFAFVVLDEANAVVAVVAGALAVVVVEEGETDEDMFRVLAELSTLCVDVAARLVVVAVAMDADGAAPDVAVGVRVVLPLVDEVAGVVPVAPVVVAEKASTSCGDVVVDGGVAVLLALAAEEGVATVVAVVVVIARVAVLLLDAFVAMVAVGCAAVVEIAPTVV
jgi:hypothetical protein